MHTSGKHVIADLWLAETLPMVSVVGAAKEAIKRGGLTVVADVLHEFGGEAFTAVWVLAESHFSIHYFPERRYVAVDCYACGGEGSPMDVIAALGVSVGVETSSIKQLLRGVAR